MKRPACFITFEGTEGAGKTTQINLLVQRLKQTGRPVLTLREPGATAIGEQIRHTLQHSSSNFAMTAETELLLLNASRAQLVREIIRPALEEGTIVCCDRYYHSTIAYQVFGRGLDLQFAKQVIEFAVGATRPDLTILLMIPSALSEARRAQRQLALGALQDRMEKGGAAFFERVDKGYHWLAANDPGPIHILDGTKPIVELSEQIWALIDPLISRRGPGQSEE